MHREFDYIGESVPELNEQTHGAFLMQVQKASSILRTKKTVNKRATKTMLNRT